MCCFQLAQAQDVKPATRPELLTITITNIGKGNDFRAIFNQDENEAYDLSKFRNPPYWQEGLNKYRDAIKESQNFVILHSHIRPNKIYDDVSALRKDARGTIIFVDYGQIKYLTLDEPLVVIVMHTENEKSFCIVNGQRAESAEEILKIVKPKKAITFATLIDKSTDPNYERLIADELFKNNFIFLSNTKALPAKIAEELNENKKK